MSIIRVAPICLNRSYHGKYQSFIGSDLTQHDFDFEISVDNKCPYCNYGFNMRDNSGKCWHDLLDDNQGEFRIVVVYVCDHCHKGFVVFHYMLIDGDIVVDKSQSVFPPCFSEENNDIEIYKISPKFYEIYNQCMIAKNDGLYELYGMGFRKAIEQLVTDYAVFRNPSDESKIIGMSLHNRIEKYFKDSEAKDSLLACKWIGNSEAHYDNDNSDGDLYLLEELIGDTLHYINRELRREKAVDINNRKGKRT